MKLKKLFAVEIASIVVLVAVVVVFVGVTPYLGSSEQSYSIDMYQKKSYPKSEISLARGQNENVTFAYNTYDPSIIVLDLSFETCENPGYLNVYCNYRTIASLYIDQETPPLTLNLISVSGLDWVEPLTAMSGINEFVFESQSQNGYAGTLNFQITLRGSR